MPDSRPEGRQKALAGWLGVTPHTRVPAPLTTTCSVDLGLLGLQALDLPGQSRLAENL